MQGRKLVRALALATPLAICGSVPDYAFVSSPLASCDDGLLNGSESDLDCGGSTCRDCGVGSICRENSDCGLGSCVQRRCQATHCADQTRSPGETDVDCGGAECAPCGIRQQCERQRLHHQRLPVARVRGHRL